MPYRIPSFLCCEFMDSLFVLSWNIRGIAKKANRDNLQMLIQSQQPSIVCLQETKKEIIDISFRKSAGAWDDKCWVEIPSCGMSGGLAIFWDGSVIVVESATGNRN